MGEQASKIGKKLESFGENFLTSLGWTELTRDKEIKCTRSSHKKETHGIDLLCKFENPYNTMQQGVIVECKNRQMRSITQAEIDNWVKELINNIECSQSAPELSDIDLSGTTLNTGLLLIHANDSFDKNKFYVYLSNINYPNRRNPINLFVAGNDRIALWTSLFAKIKYSYNNDFSFLYPSINGFSKKVQNVLTIDGMYSKYLFAQSTYTIKKENGGHSYDEPHTQKIMFFLDEITTDNFKYAWSMFKYYQQQGVGKYVFVFYPRKKDDVEFINENFISTLKSGNKPIDDKEIEKIHIDFIENRSLSPIETGGTI